jgi:phosphoribosylaminoimidazole carboxylase PurE protein
MSASPAVGIIMGSDSDLPVMEKAGAQLVALGIPFEMTVVSAHRTPDRMVHYAREAKARGLKVLIAGAGGAAHLPGMVASMTTLPVIGVPVNITALAGQDALLSIVQMPAGIPVATVAIDNATNAALLAARMLAIADSALAGRLEAHQAAMVDTVKGKIAAVEARSAELQEAP